MITELFLIRILLLVIHLKNVVVTTLVVQTATEVATTNI